MTTTTNAAVAPYPAAEVAAARGPRPGRRQRPPPPGGDATRTPQKYAALARDFRGQRLGASGEGRLAAGVQQSVGARRRNRQGHQRPARRITHPQRYHGGGCRTGRGWLTLTATRQPRAGSPEFFRSPATSTPTFMRTNFRQHRPGRADAVRGAGGTAAPPVRRGVGLRRRRPVCYNRRAGAVSGPTGRPS